MDSRQLEAFALLSRELNFSRAAAQMHIAQPAFSRIIKQLETEVRATLFHRTSRGVRLTEEGRAFQPHAEHAREAMSTGLHAVARAAQGRTGTLHVGYYSAATHTALAETMTTAHHRLPEVAFEFVPYTVRDVLLSDIEEGRVDLGVIRNSGTLPENLGSVPLLREAPVVLYPTGHRFDRLDEVTPAQLRGEHFISLDTTHDSSLKDLLTVVARHGGFEADIAQEVPNSWVAADLVAAGLGISLSYDSVAARVSIDSVHWNRLGLADFEFSSSLDVVFRKSAGRGLVEQVVRIIHELHH